MTDQYKRQTAYLCTAQQLLEGEYVRKEGWEPSYMATDVGMLSRVRIAGIVVSVPPADLIVDDGTANILLRTLENKPLNIPVGTPILVVGRPRTYGDQAYLLAEIIKPLSSARWVQYYKEHLSSFQGCIPAVPKEAAPASEEVIVQEPTPTKIVIPLSKAPSLIEVIKELDPGDGAPVDEVIVKAGGDAEKKLTMLIAEGEVFELRAGKVKVLE